MVDVQDVSLVLSTLAYLNMLTNITFMCKVKYYLHVQDPYHVTLTRTTLRQSWCDRN